MKPRRPVVEVMDPMMVEVYRNKTTDQRLQIAFDMWDFAREMIQTNVRREHPEWTEEQVQQETAFRMRGTND